MHGAGTPTGDALPPSSGDRAKPVVYGPPTPPRPQPRSLSLDERQRVLEVLHEPRFIDKAPRQVWAELLDEDEYLEEQGDREEDCEVSPEIRFTLWQPLVPGLV